VSKVLGSVIPNDNRQGHFGGQTRPLDGG